MNSKKGQLFLVSVIFIIGIFFVIYNALFNYSEIDILTPYKAKDIELFENVVDAINYTIKQTYYCNETKDSFERRMEKLKASFLEEYGKEFSIEIFYSLDCTKWLNTPSSHPENAPLNVSISISGRGRNIRGVFYFYHLS